MFAERRWGSPCLESQPDQNDISCLKKWVTDVIGGPDYSKGAKERTWEGTGWNWDLKSDFLRIWWGKLYNTTLKAKGNSGISSLLSPPFSQLLSPSLSHLVVVLSISRTGNENRKSVSLTWEGNGSFSVRPLGRLVLLQMPVLAVTMSFPLNMAI
jgi:hypothetical protein